jgi:hypothetical protein
MSLGRAGLDANSFGMLTRRLSKPSLLKKDNAQAVERFGKARMKA